MGPLWLARGFIYTGGLIMHRIVGFVSLLAALLMPISSSAGADKDVKEAYTQVGDIKMRYLEAGTGDRNLVFIPGWLMTAEVWKEQIPYFAARGFHVFAIDPRSQGLTSKTETGNTYHQQAADLFAFLKKLKLEHCTLIGWGAGVVTLLEYVSSPETLRPDALVFVDWAPPGLDEKDYPSRAAMQQARDTAIAMEDDRSKAIDHEVHGLFASQQPGIRYKELADAAAKTPAGTALAQLFDLITGDRRTAFAQILVPVLIVNSQDNRVAGEYMQSKIAGSQLHIVEKVGHALFLEKPQAFNQALEDFLGKQ
jgi:pimeloyl-ACP methyl ester carboxylesterase